MAEAQQRPNIAVLTSLDAQDRRSWSGTFYSITQALQKHCGDVTCIGPMQAPFEELCGRVRHAGAHLFHRQSFAFRHTYAVAKRYARIAERRLAGRPFDVIVALSGSTEIAFLKTLLPIMLVEDANFAVLRDYHQHFSRLTASSARQIQTMQTRSIRRADRLLYATSWAAHSAIENYHADRRKVRVLPFGANLDLPPSQNVVFARKKSDLCSLLFVGVDWERKGGEIALETLFALNRMGIKAHLTICGCVPPRLIQDPCITVIPFLDKNDSEQRKKLEELYLHADFLLLPTRNECFGIVLCEANAFGLPVLATQTGGISEVVRDGINGFTLAYDARGDTYARVIARVYQDDAFYHRLIRSSRKAFEERLNWDVWGMAARDILLELLGHTPSYLPIQSQKALFV